MREQGFLRRLSTLDAHHRLFWALGVGSVVFFLLELHAERPTQLIAAWDAFVAVEVLLAWTTFLRADPRSIRQTARLQDSSRKVIFVLMLLATVVALLAVAFILGPSRTLSRNVFLAHVTLSVGAILGSWVLMHTLFTMRYAHLYFSAPGTGAPEGARAGLIYPGGGTPDYLDFAYFSFVVGMTCQVSDVQIATRGIRRLALMHGILSFAFNTVILALTVSVVSQAVAP